MCVWGEGWVGGWGWGAEVGREGGVDGIRRVKRRGQRRAQPAACMALVIMPTLHTLPCCLIRGPQHPVPPHDLLREGEV